jgi:hypothetical protein
MCALAALYLRGGWGTFLFTMGASGALEMDRWAPLRVPNMVTYTNVLSVVAGCTG